MTLKKTIFFKEQFSSSPGLSPCISLICSSFKSLTTVISLPCQEQIHTGFHHFTEISQILYNGYILNKDKKLSKLQGFIPGAWNLPISCLNDLETQERGF